MRKILFLLTPLLFISCLSDEEAINPDTLGVWQNFDTSDGLISNDVTKIIEDQRGDLWLGTSNGIQRLSGGALEDFSGDPEAPTGRINTITEGTDGIIYAGTNSGLGLYDGSSWTFFNLLGGQPFGVLSLYTDSSGDIWMGTTEAVIGVFQGSSLFIQPYNAIVFDFFEESSSGLLLLGTFGGLVITDGSTYLPLEGLPNEDFVLSFNEDNFGSVWVGTFEGSVINALQFEPGSLSATVVDLHNSDDENGIVTIEVLRNGEVWMGTLGNGILMYDGIVMRTNFDEDGPGVEGVIQSIIQTRDGNIWIGTGGSGVFQLITE